MSLVDDILTLIPQRPPFVLVDELTSCDEEETVTGYTVTVECPLQNGGVLQPSGLVENIAQSCAARIGYRSLRAGGKVGIGVIGSVSDMEIMMLPHVGDSIVTKITVQEEVLNLTLVSALITTAGANSQTVATAKMKIALLS